jgi:hypothetical protein
MQQEKREGAKGTICYFGKNALKSFHIMKKKNLKIATF